MKSGEIEYVQRIGEAGVRHLLEKPFSGEKAGQYLIDIGRILRHLEPYRGRVLDLGCGSGWTSIFLAKAGFVVTGVDLCPDMIALARRRLASYAGAAVDFRVADYEALDFAGVFDAVLFYDALHHAEDERLALEKAHRALRPGGLCLCYEPGAGHAAYPESIEARERFGVTEKDMPPARILELGEAVGFATRQLVAYDYAGRQLKRERSAYRRLASRLRRCVEAVTGPEPFEAEAMKRNIVLLKKGGA